MFTVIAYNNGDRTKIEVIGVSASLEEAKRFAFEKAIKGAKAYCALLHSSFEDEVHEYADGCIAEVETWTEKEWTLPFGDEYSTHLKGQVECVYAGFNYAIRHTHKQIEHWIRYACEQRAKQAVTVEEFVESMTVRAGGDLCKETCPDWNDAMSRLIEAGFPPDKEIAIADLATPNGRKNRWGRPVLPWGELEEFCARLVNYLWTHNVCGFELRKHLRKDGIRIIYPETKFMVARAPLIPTDFALSLPDPTPIPTSLSVFSYWRNQYEQGDDDDEDEVDNAECRRNIPIKKG